MKNLWIFAVMLIAAAVAGVAIEACVDPLPEREPVDIEILAARMEFHGASEVYLHDGTWYFDRGGMPCKL